MYDSNDVDNYRYAQMQSSIMNKTGLSASSQSGSKVNLKNKFGSIEQSLSTLEADLRKLTTDTNESTRFMKQLNSDVADKELNQTKAKLTEEIKKLEKTVKYGISESQQRSQKIWSDCNTRLQQSENLKNSINSLRGRISQLENTLGFFSVSDSVL